MHYCMHVLLYLPQSLCSLTRLLSLSPLISPLRWLSGYNVILRYGRLGFKSDWAISYISKNLQFSSWLIWRSTLKVQFTKRTKSKILQASNFLNHFWIIALLIGQSIFLSWTITNLVYSFNSRVNIIFELGKSRT